jgi:ABC-type glycerol-3-phosphate transport system substrate-binding protein
MNQASAAPVDRFYFKLNNNFALVSQFSRGSGRVVRMQMGPSSMGIDTNDEIAGIEANADGSVPFRYNQGFGINAQSKNKAAAWAFLKFLLSDEMQRSTNSSFMGLPLNNKARAEKAELVFSGAFMGAGSSMNDQQRQGLENYRAAIEMLSDSINCFVPRDTSLNDMVTSEVQYFFGGSRTADEVARVLQNKADLYLSE